MFKPRVFVLAVSLAFAMPVWAQNASGPVTAATTPISSSGQPIDPTKNVLDTLQAAVTRLNDVISAYIKRQDDLRDSESKFQNAMRGADTQRLNDLREADTRRLNELREAETRRLDQLAMNKQIFDLELARVIRANVEASTLLLATQVKELKADSSERTAKLEQFANEQRGRASAGNEVWALIGVLAMLLLAAIGIIVNLVKNNQQNHERGDAERYRQYVDRKVTGNEVTK